jgi:WD40 repeat protein
MINSRAEAIIFLFLWVTLAASCPSALAQNPFQVFEAPRIAYHVVNFYPVGGAYKWGGIALDSQHKRIYVAHYSRVEVLDQDSGHRVGDLLAVPDVRTIAIASNLNRGFTANGGSDRRTDDRGSVTIFDTSTLETLSKIAVNPPESIIYDESTKRVFALGNKTSVIDARSGEKLGEVDLEGEPTGSIGDGKGTIFVNLSDKRAVAVIDAKTLQVTKVFPVSHCVSPHSLSYDSREQRLFIGCDDGHLFVIDALTGKFINKVQMCSGVDGSGYDQDNRLVFESCEEGVISVIHENATGAYQLFDTVKTELHAATMVFDDKIKAIYLPTAGFEPIPSKDDPTKERLMPGTLRVLVVSP